MDGDDPLKQLLDDLLDAHDRLQTANQPLPTPRRIFGWRWQRVIAASAAVFAIAASAAAAIVVTTRRSAPLSGSLPHQLLGSRYTLAVTPDLRTGHAGWCVALLDIGISAAVLPNPGTCVSPGYEPLIARGGIETLSPTTAAVNGSLLYAIVNEQVATLEAPNGVRIVPISSPSLPRGWRAVVTITTRTSANARSPALAGLVPLNAAGHDLATRINKSVAFSSRAVDPRHPPATGCRISARNMGGVRLMTAEALSEPLVKRPLGPAGLLSCYSLTFSFRGQAATATLLVDSQHPGRRPVPLPGTRPVPGRSGLHVEPDPAPTTTGGTQMERLFAGRVGAAWLVVQTPASTDTAVAMLKDLVAHT